MLYYFFMREMVNNSNWWEISTAYPDSAEWKVTGGGGGVCTICSTHKKGRFPLCNQHKTLSTKGTEDWHGHIKTFCTAVTLFHCLGTTSNCTFQPSTVLSPFVRVTYNYLTNEPTSCKLHVLSFCSALFQR